VLSVLDTVAKVQARAAPYLQGQGSLADELARDRVAEAALEYGDD
jgi:hypothetical protein